MTRRCPLSLFASARHHLQRKILCRGNCIRKVTFHHVTVVTIVVVDDVPDLTDHIHDEKRWRLVCTAFTKPP